MAKFKLQKNGEKENKLMTRLLRLQMFAVLILL